MTDRTMVCARCRRPFDARRPHGRYCSPPCRAAAWRRKQSEPVLGAAGRPTRPRSGLQVSYHKAVEAVVAVLRAQEANWTDRERRIAAEHAMHTALSPAQRARLDARQ